jgi:hypothetical protein
LRGVPLVTGNAWSTYVPTKNENGGGKGGKGGEKERGKGKKERGEERFLFQDSVVLIPGFRRSVRQYLRIYLEKGKVS